MRLIASRYVWSPSPTSDRCWLESVFSISGSNSNSNSQSDRHRHYFVICNLSTTEAYRHDGVGLVERAQQMLLVTMTRVSNEGGAHWVDHLPFLLLSMRATAGYVLRSTLHLLYIPNIALFYCIARRSTYRSTYFSLLSS
eukprot:scaffold88402_cov28-Tisochrysis_lutea.AAC.1